MKVSIKVALASVALSLIFNTSSYSMDAHNTVQPNKPVSRFLKKIRESIIDTALLFADLYYLNPYIAGTLSPSCFNNNNADNFPHEFPSLMYRNTFKAPHSHEEPDQQHDLE